MRLLFSLIIFILSVTLALSDERTEKLKKLLEKGLITEAEFKKALNMSEKPKSINQEEIDLDLINSILNKSNNDFNKNHGIS